MATSAAEIEFVADEPIDFVPDDAPPAAAIEFVPDEVDPVVAQEAQRASMGAVQALDVMRAPMALDWTDVREGFDERRLYDARSAEAQAMLAEDRGSGTGPGSDAFNWRREAERLRADIRPDTAAGRALAGEEQGISREIEEVAGSQRPATPSDVVGGLMGPGLSANVLPAVEAAGRAAGPAAAGALGAAKFIPHPGARALAQFAGPMFGAITGSIAGGAAQESVLQTTETPEETQARQQRAADDAAANPGLTRVGAAAASLPYFGLSLAQFGRAAAGDRGAMMNLGLSGALGAGVEFAGAKMRGEEAKPEDIAAAFFSNVILNEPTRLGRRMGLKPSSEQQAVEAAEAKYGGGVPPIGRPPTSEVGTIAGMRRVPSVVEQAAPAEVPPMPIRSSEAPAPTDEARIAQLVEAGMTPEDAAAGLAQIKAAEAPPVESAAKGLFSKYSNTEPSGQNPKEGVPESIHFNLGNYWTKPVDVPIEELANIEIAAVSDRSKARVKAAAEEGKELPPVEIAVWRDGETHVLDGNHRIAEARERGSSSIKVKFTFPDKEVLPIPPPPEPPVIPPAAAEAPLPPPDPNATSLKNAQVDAERVERGLPPMDEVVPISDKELWARAEAIETADPLAADRLVTELNASPRSISSEETMLLLRNRVRLQSDYRQANLDIIAAKESGDALALERAETAKREASDALTRNEMATGRGGAGTEQGRAFRLRRLFAKEDFSAPTMIAEERARRGGEQLAPEEVQQIENLSEELIAEQKVADVALEKAEVAATEKRVDETISTVAKQPDLEPAVKSLADRIIAKLDARAEAARARLREKFKRTNAGVDPTILADFVDLAASTISKSAIKSGQWIASMIKEWGEEARPYLQAAWDAADKQLDVMVDASTSDKKKRATVKAKILDAGAQQSRVTAAIAERLKEGESIDDLGRYVDRLVESIVRGGTKDRTAVLAAVKGALEPMVPGITDRQVLDLVSGYGNTVELSKDPVKVVKAQIKAETLQLSKLEALAKKEPLKATGPRRYPQTDEQRRLTREVNEAKKAAGVVTTDPATQLKSTLDSARTRFSNEIKDLTLEIETGQRPPTRTPVEYTQDIEIMRGLRDRLRQTVRELAGPTQRTEEQRIAITRRGLNDAIAALEARIAGQKPKAKPLAPDTPEIRALKAKRDALREELNEVNAADSLLQENRKAEALVRSIEQTEAVLAGATKAGKVQGPESQLVAEAREQLAAVREQIRAKADADPAVQQERMDAAEAAVEKAIRKLDQQLQAGDIAVQRAPSPAASQRLEDLRMQRDAMNKLRNQLRMDARPKPNPLDVAIKTRAAALKRQEADYEGRIARQEFGPRTRKPPVDISGNKDAMDALARVQGVKDKFAKLQKEWELKNRTKTQKVKDAIGQAWDATRNLMLSFDLSAPLQTAFSIAARPVQGAKAMGVGARVFAEQLFRNSDTYAKRVQQQIENSPNNKNGLYKEMKLDLSLGDKREENAGSILERFADLESRWQDIPDFVKGLFGLQGKPLVKGAKGIAKALPKVLGMGIKASNAGFNAVANHMRARTADAMLARWARRRGMPSKQQLELLGNQINAATGKGGLRGESAVQKLLFAPNYYLSILKQLSLQPVRKAAEFHEGGVAREILEDYARAAATILSIGALQYLFGDREKQTLDPRSKDFARMKTDKGTSIDFTMGRGAWVTLAAQLAPDWAGGGKSIDKKGRLVKQDRGTALLNFIKGRLSREISTAITTGAGTDFRGKPIDAAAIAQEMVTPLSWRDVDKVLKREGLTRGALIQMLNMVGVTHRLAE